MVKLKKGLKCTSYRISLMQRGHTKKKEIDLVLTFKGRLVERLGYARWYKDTYMYIVFGDKFMKWIISSNYKITNSAKKWLIKYLWSLYIKQNVFK